MSTDVRKRQVAFGAAVDDVTAGNKKIKRSELLDSGRLPVIDQGSRFVAGYTDDEDAIFLGELPVIVFGDHTLTFKYVDFPFALGADGVRVLKPRPAYHPKYVYYFWQSRNIVSRGYSRHFKFLREMDIPLIPLSEQRRIVEILDQANELRKRRKEADEKAARILPALFYKMFGDPVSNSQGHPRHKLSDPDICTLNPKSNGELDSSGQYSFIPMSAIDEHWGRIVQEVSRPYEEVRRGYTSFQENDVLFAKITPCMENGKAAIASGLVNGRGFGSTEFHVLRAGKKATPEWLYGLVRLPAFREYAKASFTGSVGHQRVPAKFLEQYNVPLPPLEDQRRFAQMVNTTFENLDRANVSGNKLDTLHSVLVHRAFKGELISRWREAHAEELQTEMEEQARLLNIEVDANQKL